MTYKEALKNGYKNGDTKLHRGYLSRKINIDNQEVKVAGGSRRGQLYVELPCYISTQYTYRQYLVKA